MRQPLPLHPKQHADSPLLWLAVVSGSLLCNAALTLGLQSYLASTQPHPANPTAIAVQFIDPPAPHTTAIAPPAPRPPTPPVTAAAPAVEPVTPPTVAPPRLALAPAARPPQRLRPLPPPTRPPAPAASLAPQPMPLAGEPTPPPPAPTAPAIPPPSPPPPQVATSGIQLPGFVPPPDPTQNPGDATTPTTATLPLPQNPTPAKFVVQIQILEAVGDPDAERAIVPHQSQPLTKTFRSGEAGCVLTPASLQGFNAPLQFTLTLNPTGKVTQTVPLSNQNHQSYADLATCALKAWNFDQAMVVASTTPTVTIHLLRVTVILTLPRAPQGAGAGASFSHSGRTHTFLNN